MGANQQSRHPSRAASLLTRRFALMSQAARR
jgi:hypothetical protein